MPLGSAQALCYTACTVQDKSTLLEIDGSQGEGGGQVLRTSLSLAALLTRPFRLTNIRARRSKPGLRPQHLTAVRAVAAICGAELEGATLNSQELIFRPRFRPRGGHYTFDVNEASVGGSAGSITLILQALLVPLLFAEGASTLTLRGGTHVPFSPPYHYLAHVVEPLLARMGAALGLTLLAYGWYPAGGGEISATIAPTTGLEKLTFSNQARDRVRGVAAVTNLPAHIPQRMARRAHNLLVELGLRPNVQPVRETGPGAGAGVFLWTDGGGFSSLGRKGLPAEAVAEAAVADCRAFMENKVDVDRHLADQLLLPLALVRGSSDFTTDEITLHTLTNASLLRRWLDTPISITGNLGEPGHIAVTGCDYSA